MAETELKNIAAIPYQIVSPANNAPTVGIFQDSLLGSFRMTREGVQFMPKEAMNLLMAFPHVDLNRLNEDFYEKGSSPGPISCFQLLSQVLPPISMIQKNKQFGDQDIYSESNNVIEIRNGYMVRGRMDASIKSIIHRIYNDYGYKEASDFINNWQNIITEYMKTSAFSVGISDLLADVKTKEKIQESIKIVDNNFQKISITGFDGNKANSIQWKIGCIDKKLYERGLPHTRDDIIIISKKILNDYDTMRLAQTLAHEKVHIYQKIYKDDIQEYLNENNIKLIKKRTMNDLGRANPDLDDYIYKDDKIVYSANYNTEHPTSIEDITYNPKYGQSSEHPFEKMAIEIENKIF